jgi:hypothetical protein
MVNNTLNCDFCKNPYICSKWKWSHRSLYKTLKQYCTEECEYKANNKGFKTIVTCKNCNKELFKLPNQIKKYPNNFCNRSCSATFNNKNKKYGTRRSKLENWLEEQLTIIYPNLEIHYNRKDTINSELDLYFPSLKLAIELNGIFHYEPIYGKDKLKKITNNDDRKFQACLENKIELCIIDVSKLSYFKLDNAKPYLNIIIIKKKSG